MRFFGPSCISCIYFIILYKDMLSDNIDIKTIGKTLSDLNQLRTKYIFSLLQGKSMIHGLPHFIYRKCGKKNCKCAKGNRHGPYAALSINKNGKQRIAIIRKSDTYPVMKEAKRYRYFQETLSKIRKINREIDTLLEKVKVETTYEYPGQ